MDLPSANWLQISTKASWVTEGESPTTVARRGRFEPKTLFSLLFKWNNPALIHAVDKDKTVDPNYYMENCLKHVVKEKGKQRKSSAIKLLHNNAHPILIPMLSKEGIILMPHLLYSPNFVPYDYQLSDDIKWNLIGQPNERLLSRAASKVVKNIPK